MEERAREARYQAFSDLLVHGEWILTAHHQQDQAESVLINLLRGSGPQGLAGIAASRVLGAGYVGRPLLHVAKSDISEYADCFELEWIEDPSNQDLHLTRNYLRHEIMPRLSERFPTAAANIARSGALCAESAESTDAWADELLPTMTCNDQLSATALAKWSVPQQKLLLRRWLRQQGAPTPSQRVLLEIIEQMLGAAGDREPLVQWGDVVVRRYQQEIYLMPSSVTDTPRGAVSLELERPVELHNGDSYLLRKSASNDRGRVLLDSDDSLEVRFRQSGESIRLNGVEKSLKKLFQDARIPPWERWQMPLLYANDELVAVADRWIDERRLASAKCTAFAIEWNRSNAACSQALVRPGKT